METLRAYNAQNAHDQSTHPPANGSGEEPYINIHDDGSVAEFLDIVDSACDCVSCLDFARVEGYSPEVVGYV